MTFTSLDDKPQIRMCGIAAVQCCVPQDWSDQAVLDFAGPSGTTHGWHVRKAGDPNLAGAAERVACEGRAGFVHVMLDC